MPLRNKGRSGMTLVEVLLAAALLGLGLVALLSGLSSCLAIMRASREYQEAQWAMSLAMLEHPVREFNEIEDLVVESDTTLVDGFAFSRQVDEKDINLADDDDGLYVVRTKITWGEGGEGQTEELVSLIWEKGGKRE